MKTIVTTLAILATSAALAMGIAPATHAAPTVTPAFASAGSCGPDDPYNPDKSKWDCPGRDPLDPLPGTAGI